MELELKKECLDTYEPGEPQTLTQEETLSLDAGQAELEITCNFKGAGNILKTKKNPKIKVLDCTDEEIME